jgi:hypothetical protein
MADRSYIICPFCEKQLNQQNELFSRNPEVHIFKCSMGHSFEYAGLMAMNPSKIPYQHHEKPGQNDVKAEFWLDPKILSRFREKYANQQSSTVNSILQLSLDDDLIMVSGDQARKLKELGIRTAAEMVARVQVSRTLEAENADLVSKLNYFSEMMKGAGVAG